MGALDKHREALEVHETMMGQGRGRLAVAMDLLTDALAMIGQHNVYCQSTRVPGRPTLDIVALSHPNVTTVFDVGEHEGRIFIVFEFLKGQSLRHEMGGRPLNVRRAMDLAVQMADALADAHACGYVHGGLSPDSVVVTAKGHSKIPA